MNSGLLNRRYVPTTWGKQSPHTWGHAQLKQHHHPLKWAKMSPWHLSWTYHQLFWRWNTLEGSSFLPCVFFLCLYFSCYMVKVSIAACKCAVHPLTLFHLKNTLLMSLFVLHLIWHVLICTVVSIFYNLALVQYSCPTAFFTVCVWGCPGWKTHIAYLLARKEFAPS